MFVYYGMRGHLRQRQQRRASLMDASVSVESDPLLSHPRMPDHLGTPDYQNVAEPESFLDVNTDVSLRFVLERGRYRLSYDGC